MPTRAATDPVALLIQERERRRQRQVVQRQCEKSLWAFVREFWPIVEPATELMPGRTMEAICQHLEAVASGEIRRLLINVPPGTSKSLLSSVFFPAWVWGPRGRPATRFLCASYSAHLTERDNERCLRIMLSEEYKGLWPARIDKTGVTKISTTATGWKLATSIGGVGTGERADIVLIDDANNVREAESQIVREATNRWLTEVIPTRLSEPTTSAIVNIQQRTHEDDATGKLLQVWPEYEHLMLPMHYDPQRHCRTSIGFEDWRTVEGELLWPERFPESVVAEYRKVMGSYAAAGQLEQSPHPRGGGVVQRDWWQAWPPAGQVERWTSEDGRVRLPSWELVVAYLDTAFTVKDDNAWCALTRWGVFEHDGVPKVMLSQAWRDRPTLRGLVDRVMETCRRGKVDVLVIENRAGAEWVRQELQQLMRKGEWSVVLDEPRGDKLARLHSVTPLFEDGVIHAPDTQWADMVIDEVAAFPSGRWKDLTDTVSGALGYLRRNGLIRLAAEHKEDEIESRIWRGRRETVAEVYGV